MKIVLGKTNTERKKLTRQWVSASGITYKHLSKCLKIDATYLSAMVGKKAKRVMPDNTWARIVQYFGVIR